MMGVVVWDGVMCICSVVQESMWWNGNQIRDNYSILKKEEKKIKGFSLM